VKWALYEEKHFKRLIKQEQLKLCEIEVSKIGLETLSALMDIVQAQDKDLEAAISAAIRSDVGTV
jgi:hypothetical protein